MLQYHMHKLKAK